MLPPLIALITLAGLSIGPFWRKHRDHLPLFLWAVYCGLGPVEVLGVQPLRYRWVMAFVIGAFGCWWFSRSRPRTLDSMTVTPLLFIAWAFTSVIYSDIPKYSFARAGALVPMYAAVFLGVRALLKRPQGIERVARCLLTMMGVSLALSIAYWISNEDIVGTTAQQMASKSYRFQGHLKATGIAHAIAAATPFLVLLLTKTRGWRSGALLAATALSLYLLLLTRSRGGLISCAAVIPICYFAIFRELRTARTVVYTLIVAILGTIAWQAFGTEDTAAFLRLGDAASMLRTRVEGRWDIIWDGAMQNPLIGNGYGAVRFVSQTGATSWDLGSTRENQIMTHNEYLSLFYDLGVVPTLAFLGFMATIAARGLRSLRWPPSPLRSLLIATFMSWFVDALDTISHDGLMTIGNPVATWFWIKSLMIYYGYDRLRGADIIDDRAANQGRPDRGNRPSTAT